MDVDSLDPEGADLSDILAEALGACVENDPDLKATVYFYFTSSVNFGEMTSSEFITVAGPVFLYEVLFKALRGVSGLRIRKSDMLKPEVHHAVLHVEQGNVWVPADALSWGALAKKQGSDRNA